MSLTSLSSPLQSSLIRDSPSSPTAHAWDCEPLTLTIKEDCTLNFLFRVSLLFLTSSALSPSLQLSWACLLLFYLLRHFFSLSSHGKKNTSFSINLTKTAFCHPYFSRAKLMLYLLLFKSIFCCKFTVFFQLYYFCNIHYVYPVLPTFPSLFVFFLHIPR